MKKKHPLTAEMTMAEVLKLYPQVETILIKYKLHCVGCEASSYETIEEAAKTHNVKDVSRLLYELNEVV